MTTKSREAFQEAASRASRFGNPELQPEHLLAATLDQDGGVAAPLLQKAGADVSALRDAVADTLAAMMEDGTYQKILDSLVPFNQDWAKSAPVLVLAVAKMTFTAKGTSNRYGLHDTGAAMANLALQATADGLHTHSMAGFDNEQMRASFAIPSDYELGAVTAIGYFGDPENLPDHLRKMEVSPRQRKPLEEFVFSAWEKPAHF